MAKHSSCVLLVLNASFGGKKKPERRSKEAAEAKMRFMKRLHSDLSLVVEKSH